MQQRWMMLDPTMLALFEQAFRKQVNMEVVSDTQHFLEVLPGHFRSLELEENHNFQPFGQN